MSEWIISDGEREAGLAEVELAAIEAQREALKKLTPEELAEARRDLLARQEGLYTPPSEFHEGGVIEPEDISIHMELGREIADIDLESLSRGIVTTD